MEDMDLTPTRDDSPMQDDSSIAELQEDGTEATEQDAMAASRKENVQVEEVAATSIGPALSEESKLEKQFRGSLDDLQELMKMDVGEECAGGEDNEVFGRLHRLASTVHQTLLAYGYSVEMGLSSSLESSEADSPCMQELPDLKRETLRGIGKEMWMTMRSNPSMFQDNVKPSLSKDTANALGAENSYSGQTAFCSSREKGTGGREKAAASGYIRAITARLVLIDHIQTKGRPVPVLMNKLSVAKEADNESLNRVSLPAASPRELEFGLKCFVRSGRALLVHASEPKAAFVALLLAASFWKGIVVTSESEAWNTALTNAAFKTHSLAAKQRDEAFDAFVLLPDAVSLVGEESNHNGTKLDPIQSRAKGQDSQPEEECSSSGCSEQILSHLGSLEEFVLQHCMRGEDSSDGVVLHDGTNGNNPEPVGILAVHRYLPTLARAAYKHGNCFVRNQRYSNAFVALRMALGATNRCLAYIEELDSDSERSSMASSFQIQKREMLVVSKECLYILSHVQQATGKKEEAHKCLNRLEDYIDKQSRLDEQQYTSTMNKLKEANNANGAGHLHVSITETLTADGPMQQDIAEIKSRAQAAMTKAKYAEATERSNVAFSRIMLANQSLPQPTGDDEKLIDSHLKVLAELSIKYPGGNKGHPLYAVTRDASLVSDVESDSLKLTLAAARGIRIRRLLAVAQNGDVQRVNEGNPYEILLNEYVETHPKHTFIILDHLRSLLSCVQTAHDKTPRFQEETVSGLDDLAVSVAKELLSKLKTSITSASKSQDESTLFAGLEKGSNLLVNETRSLFARALVFYRGRSAFSRCTQWADFVLQTLQDLSVPLETQDGNNNSEQVIADAMAIKAYSLSRTPENHALALNIAREAWKRGPSVTNLSVLFHCRVAGEPRDSVDETLLELETALARLESEKDSPASDVEVFAIFPTLAKSCYENDSDGSPLLLGVQRMWIEAFVSNSIEIKDALSRQCDCPLFVILKFYLQNAELVWEEHSKIQDTTSIERSAGKLNESLHNVLAFLVKLRDGVDSQKRQKTADGQFAPERRISDSIRLWGSECFEVIGEHKDCVFIAEQLWNLALVDGIPPTISSELLAKAHDFFLLSEEELGDALTRCHLDCDIRDDVLDDFEAYSSLVTLEKTRAASVLSSEFSAQCLLVSVTKVIDNVHITNSNDSTLADATRLRRVRRSLIRLYMAKQELSSPETNHGSRVEGVTSWLELRCLIEIGDDLFCRMVLEAEQLLLRLSSLNSLSNPSGLDTDANGRGTVPGNMIPENTASVATDPGRILAASSVASWVFAASLRANSQNMRKTEKLLLQASADMISQRGATSLKTLDGRIHSLGDIQKALLRLATGVEDVLAVFDKVDTRLKGCKSVEGETSIPLCFSKQDLDCFAIESYNRGLNLLFLGDMASAEKLLAIALNILPFCGEEVESYAADMRRAYANLVDQRSSGGSFSSASGALVMNLFGSDVTGIF